MNATLVDSSGSSDLMVHQVKTIAHSSVIPTVQISLSDAIRSRPLSSVLGVSPVPSNAGDIFAQS